MIEKEFRALLPVWVACGVALLASTSHVRILRDLGVPAYFFGAAALGALSMGHEYSHGTLAALLCLPISRTRMWLSKLAVLAGMLLPLAALSWWTLALRTGDLRLGLAIYGLPVLAGLLLAPWLTMICRSPLAGAVFTLSAAGTLVVGGQLVGLALYGAAGVGRFLIDFIWWGMLALCAAAALMGWRTFTRLEAIDGRDADVDLSFASRGRRLAPSRGVTRTSPLRLLIVKELRLQQLACAVAALYVAGYVTAVATRGDPNADNLVTIITVLYALLVSPLIGSLACAEERSLGTHDAQVLLPMSSARQWTVKAGTALALTVVLAIALPIVLVWLVPPTHGRLFVLRRLLNDTPILWALAFTTVSLFVSSLAGSGLRALLLSIPAVAALITFVTGVALPLAYSTLEAVYHPTPTRWPPPTLGKDAIWLVLTAAIMLLVLRFALSNYRSADRSVLCIGAQVAWTAAGIAACFALAGLLRAV